MSEDWLAKMRVGVTEEWRHPNPTAMRPGVIWSTIHPDGTVRVPADHLAWMLQQLGYRPTPTPAPTPAPADTERVAEGGAVWRTVPMTDHRDVVLPTTASQPPTSGAGAQSEETR